MWISGKLIQIQKEVTNPYSFAWLRGVTRQNLMDGLGWQSFSVGRNPAITSWYGRFIPLFTRFYTSQVVQDSFHQQYHLPANSFIHILTQSYTIEIQEFSRVTPRGLRTLCSKYCKYFNELGCRVGSARITVCNPLTPKSSARPFAKHHLMIGVKTERRLYAYRDNV